MSEWTWVAAGYAITYVSVAAYFAVLHRRRARLGRSEGRRM